MIYRKRKSSMLRSGAIVSMAALATMALILIMHHATRDDHPMQCTDDTIYLASNGYQASGLQYIYGLGDDSDKLSNDPPLLDAALTQAIEQAIIGQALVVTDQQHISRQPMIVGDIANHWAHLVNLRSYQPQDHRRSTSGACDVPEPGMLLLIASGLISFLIISKGRYGISK